MSRRNYVEELEYSDTKGVDSASPINLLSPGYVRVAKNVNLGSTGGYTKRQGYENQLGSSSPAAVYMRGKSIRQGIDYKTSLGSVRRLLYITNNGTNAEFGRISTSLTGTFEPLQDKNGVELKLNPFARPSLAQMLDSLYYFDGSGTATTPFVYENNGLYTRPLGTAAPGSHADQTEVTGEILSNGDLIQGRYIFAVTYVFLLNNSIIVESSPSNFVELEITTPTGGIKLTIPTHPVVKDSLVSHSHLQIGVRLWRTVANGSILFLENPEFVPAGEFGSDTFNYNFIASDNALLSEQMPFDNTQLSEYVDYNKARFPMVARNRMLVFHPEQNKGRFSKIGVNGPLPESFPVQNEFSIEGKYGASDSLVGAGQIRGIPIILKERSIGKLEEVGLPDLGNSDDNITYIYREISEVTGAVSHFAQCQVFDELIFLGKDNVYATDGNTVRPIATQIQNLIKQTDITSTKTYKLSAINDTKNKRIYIQVFSNSKVAEPDLTLVGDYQQYPNFRWTTYEAGPTDDDESAGFIVYPGIKAGCFFQTEATISGGLDIYFGSASYEGMYYKMNTGDSDWFDGQPSYIWMEIITRPYMFSQPLITKLYKKAKVLVEARDNTYSLRIKSRFDLDADTSTEREFNILKSAGVWANTTPDTNDFLWAENNTDVTLKTLYWTGPQTEEFNYDLHKKAKMIQLTFIQSDRDAPITLLGWGVSGSIFTGI